MLEAKAVKRDFIPQCQIDAVSLAQLSRGMSLVNECVLIMIF